jgi:hypothetical protein
LCYRPAVFLHHHLIVLLVSKEKFATHLKNVVIAIFFSCAGLKLHNVKSLVSGSVCSVDLQLLIFNFE